jgi:hypothetical protein
VSRFLAAFVLLAVVFLAPPLARAELLATASLDVEMGRQGILVQASPRLIFGGDSGFVVLYDGFQDGLSTAGSPSTAFDLTGDRFSLTKELLTNAQDDFFTPIISTVVNNTPGASSGNGPLPESQLLITTFSRSSGIPDLAGAQIDRITLMFPNPLSSPGSDPNRDGNWTDFIFQPTLSVYGVRPVPEPSTAGLVLCGLIALAFAARAASRRRSSDETPAMVFAEQSAVLTLQPEPTAHRHRRRASLFA